MIIISTLLFLITIMVVGLIYNWEKKQGRFPFPSPGLAAVGVLFVYYAIPSFINVLYPNISVWKRNYYGYALSLYNYTSFIGLISLIALYLGFVSGISIKVKTKKSFKIVERLESVIKRISVSRLFIIAVLFCLIGVGADLYKQSIGWIHYGGALKVYERSNPINQILQHMKFQCPETNF